VVGFIAGATAPPASAWATRVRSFPAARAPPRRSHKALKEAGIAIAPTPAELAATLKPLFEVRGPCANCSALLSPRLLLALVACGSPIVGIWTVSLQQAGVKSDGEYTFLSVAPTR
jgi:hypothetical protein